MDALTLCRDRLPVTAYIGAGAIRSIVWDHLHGHVPAFDGDVDVVFFDPACEPDADAGFKHLLRTARPALDWDVTNQAHVHSWYRDYFGRDVPQLDSLAQMIATWPDTATAVAVRLDGNGQFDVVAPFGLDDLFDLVLRWNPSRVSLHEFDARIESKQFTRRWPRIRVHR